MTDTQLDINQILNYLPHRYPFLLVDKVLRYEDGKELVAIKNVTINEPFFTGHFPENAVMPGVLLVESLAQAGAVLAYITTRSNPRDSIFYLAALDNVKFKQIVRPGDQLTLKVGILSQRSTFWKIYGEASVDNHVACTVEILSAMRKL
ncbi:MAG TPA: 3-hydroxyacyl-ACP dehydratase FabZ [Gammaproteobacteria bacterium]|nr:3-hydroxyacyl-ACP dehydratase FabZ [Gammaproteobacteria bacterium]